MIADHAKNEVQSTMMGESVTMGIRAEDMAHIMDVLAGLYKNRLGAVIREYSTNARDAHIEAGFSGPVEVTLPSMMDPTFRVRDYGHGLDRDGIREVYSQYGRSTKRASNDQVGMLGLGSKCALSYTQGFTVVSVKDGRRLTVLVSMDEEGAGQMQILGKPEGEPTQDANGTEIQVAIRREDIGRAASEAADFFSYWDAGTVTVNGKEPQRFDAKHKTMRLGDDLYIVSNGQSTQGDRVVMGGVAYPQIIDLGIQRSWSLVAMVPIGSVRPTPSREGLKDTPQTVAMLKQLRAAFEKNVKGAIQREVNKAKTPSDAVSVVIDWAQYLPGSAVASNYTYQGKTLPAVFTPKAPPVQTTDKWGRQTTEYPLEVVPFRNSYRKSDSSRYRDWPLSKWASSVWVYDFQPVTFTAQHKNKLLKWAADNQVGMDSRGYQDGSVQHFVLLREAKPDSAFIDDARCVSWEVIKKIQLQPVRKAYNGTARIPGSYDIITEDGYKHGVPGDQLRQDVPLFYVHGNRYTGHGYAPGLEFKFKKFTIVCLSANRIDKWKRDVPKSREVREGVKEAFDAWIKTVTLDQKLALHMMGRGHQRTCYHIPAGVKDPALLEARRLARIDVTKTRNQMRSFASQIAGVDDQFKVTDWKNPLNNYPLFQAHLAKDPHTLIYLNAAFAAKP